MQIVQYYVNIYIISGKMHEHMLMFSLMGGAGVMAAILEFARYRVSQTQILEFARYRVSQTQKNSREDFDLRSIFSWTQCKISLKQIPTKSHSVGISKLLFSLVFLRN